MSEVNVFDGERPLSPDDAGTAACAEGGVDFGAHFTYLGDEFPVKVRYYLKETQPPPKIAVIYSHHEVRLGRDFSWTKTVYAQSPACEAPEGWVAVHSTLQPAYFDPAQTNSLLGYGPDGRIWQVGRTGEMAEPLSAGIYSSFSPSPDGRWIAAQKAGSTEIWLLDRAKGQEFSLGLEGHSIGDWRPDGESFFFASPTWDLGEYHLEAGSTHWWARQDQTMPHDFRQVRTVVEIPALPIRIAQPRLGPSGKELLLAGVDTNDAMILRLDLDAGHLYAYPGTETDGFSPVWHPDAGYALFGFPGTRLLDLQTGKVTLLPAEYRVRFIADVSDDGQLLAVMDEGCWSIGPVPPLN